MVLEDSIKPTSNGSSNVLLDDSYDDGPLLQFRARLAESLAAGCVMDDLSLPGTGGASGTGIQGEIDSATRLLSPAPLREDPVDDLATAGNWERSTQPVVYDQLRIDTQQVIDGRHEVGW